MTIEEKLIQVADAIREGKKITYRQYRRGLGEGWGDIKFLDIDFKIEDKPTPSNPP